MVGVLAEKNEELGRAINTWTERGPRKVERQCSWSFPENSLFLFLMMSAGSRRAGKGAV